MNGTPQLIQSRSLRTDAAAALTMAEAAAIENPRVASGLRMMAANFHGEAQRLEREAALYATPTIIVAPGLMRGNADLVDAV